MARKFCPSGFKREGKLCVKRYREVRVYPLKHKKGKYIVTDENMNPLSGIQGASLSEAHQIAKEKRTKGEVLRYW